MNVGSLFSGIGGFDLGLERVGMHTAWFCEQDEFCQRVLAKHWPGVPCYGDIRELSGADVQPVDVLCGGFPCQDISVAGAGAGIGGARSGLWAEYARLIGELRPRYIVVENVSALLARGLGVVLGDLAALGYDAEWDCIPASAVGAHHQRDRVWLVAYPQCQQLRQQPGWGSGTSRAGAPLVAVDGPAWPVADADSIGRDGRSRQLGTAGRNESEDGSADVADSDTERRREGLRIASGPVERPRARDAVGCGEQLADPNREPAIGTPVAWAERSPWPAEPDVGRVAYGVPNRMDRVRALGNALVPQIAEWIGHRIMSYEESR